MAASLSFDLDALNQRFEGAHPRDILAWAVTEIPQGLVQTSAFNVDDMVITDLLYRDLCPQPPVPVLFLDTLHHFAETLAFVQQAQEKYGLDLHTYKTPDVDSRESLCCPLWRQALGNQC
ncbi:MAG: hypothetical protein KatS3mg067_1250 [Thermosynechococcus sp.]|nr:MAG: hypothetical protein KatS3mg067_1250 [Thermosynechococcus sp.]